MQPAARTVMQGHGAVSLVGLVGLFSIHCSAAPTGSHPGDAGAGPTASSTGDSGGVTPGGDSAAGAAGDAGDPADAFGPSRVEQDAEALCEAIEDDAAAQFEVLVQQNLACTGDDDCTRALATGGDCVAPCGHVLTNEAGAQTLGAAASSLCAPFVDAGCQLPGFGCPAVAPLNICAAGQCEGWAATLVANGGPFVHGVCASFEIEFSTAASRTALAPHDLAFALTPENGTLYADSTCATASTDGTVTLPGGANSVTFGFVPLATGPSGFSGSGPDEAIIGIEFSAQ
jgi:hypothetical protein